MSTTNDIYNEAIKDSTLHFDEYNEGYSKGVKVFTVLLTGCVAYMGFHFYQARTASKNSIDKTLIVQKEVVERKIEPKIVREIKKVRPIELASAEVASVKVDSEDNEYLMALQSIENEISQESEIVSLNPKIQKDLSLAMSSLIEDTKVADSTDYTKELKKELGVLPKKMVAKDSMMDEVRALEEAIQKDNIKVHKVIVQKGDTLEGLSDEFYGDAMNYKRIIASNENIDSSGLIYEGETIILPY